MTFQQRHKLLFEIDLAMVRRLIRDVFFDNLEVREAHSECTVAGLPRK